MDSIKIQQKLGVFRLHNDVEIPALATEKSACFDLNAYLRRGETIIAYNQYGHKKEMILDTDCIDMIPQISYEISYTNRNYF